LEDGVEDVDEGDKGEEEEAEGRSIVAVEEETNLRLRVNELVGIVAAGDKEDDDRVDDDEDEDETDDDEEAELMSAM
jgi:hypothetical protein